MPGIRVVTDSACDLSEELAAGAGIRIVPLTIRFGDEELLDRVDLTSREFWRRCKGSPALPETAAPPPGAFQAAFEAAAAEGADGVVCCTLSSAVSATYQAALVGAGALDGSIPVEVVDSRSVSMGQGLACLSGAELAASGADLAAVAAHLREVITRVRVIGVVGTLDHLQRGGRIGGAAALVGSLLSIKPVIEVRDGAVVEESKQRTRTRALDYVVAKVRAQAPLERLAICGGAADDVASVIERLGDVAVAHEPVAADLGPVVGTHAGPGSVAVCYILAGTGAPAAAHP